MKISMFNKIILLSVLFSDIEIIIIIIINDNKFHRLPLDHWNFMDHHWTWFPNIFVYICEHFMRKPLLHSNYERSISMLILHMNLCIWREFLCTRRREMISKTVHRFNHVHNKSMVISNQLHAKHFSPEEQWTLNELSDYMDWLSNKLAHLYSNRKKNVFIGRASSKPILIGM